MIGISLPAVAADDPTKTTIVVGRISDNPDKHYPGTRALASYLARNMADLGITEGRVLMTESAAQMAQHVKEGRVDIVKVRGLHAVALEEAGTEIFLKGNHNGTTTYRTVFFARKDSGINSLNDLRGKIIAFEDQYSASSYLIPAGTLLSQKFELQALRSPRDAVTNGRIGYVFAGGEDVNSMLMVQKRIVHASVTSDVEMTRLRAASADVRDDFKIIHRTGDFPRSLVVVRSGLSTTVKTRLRQLLLTAGETPDGTKALKEFNSLTSFERLDKRDLTNIADGRRLAHLVQTQLK